MPKAEVDPVRSRIMKSVRRYNTTPEVVVRKALHKLGFRFRLHRKALPGTPDIVLPRYRTAIFVHGCFWHRHEGCSKATTPKTHIPFWTQKFERNVERDAGNEDELVKAGWRVLVLWECETKRLGELSERLLGEIAGTKVAAPSATKSKTSKT